MKELQSAYPRLRLRSNSGSPLFILKSLDKEKENPVLIRTGQRF